MDLFSLTTLLLAIQASTDAVQPIYTEATEIQKPAT
jgi:hypothetical protein